MGQTGVIFFALLVGFVVFITMRSELTPYLQVVGLAAGGRTNCSGSGSGQTGTYGQPGAGANPGGVLNLPVPPNTGTSQPM